MKIKRKFTKILLALVLALSFVVPFDRAIGADENAPLVFPSIYTINLKNKGDIYTKYKVIVKDGETNIYEETREITNDKIEVDFKSDSIIGTATNASAEFYLINKDDNTEKKIYTATDVVAKPVEYLQYDVTSATINKVDSDAPTITANAGDLTADNTVVISATASDNYTGKLMYKFDEKNGTLGTWQDSANFTVSKNGTYVVTVKDASDNVSAPMEVSVTTILYTLTSVSQTSIAVSNDKTVTYTYAIDATQGNVPTKYVVKKGNEIVTNETAIAADATSVEIVVTDLATDTIVFSDNEKGSKSFLITPSECVLDPSDITINKFDSAESITFNNASLAITKTSLQSGNKFKLSSSEFSENLNEVINANDKYTLTVKTRYGQEVSKEFAVLNVDKNKPVININIDNSNIAREREVEFTLSDSDYDQIKTIAGLSDEQKSYVLKYDVVKKVNNDGDIKWEKVEGKSGTIDLNSGNTVRITLNENGDYQFVVKDAIETRSSYIDFKVSKIDSTGPESWDIVALKDDQVTEVPYILIEDIVNKVLNKVFNTQTVTVNNVIDEGGAGIDTNSCFQFVEVEPNTETIPNEANWKGYNDKCQLVNKTNYILFVKDKFGNINKEGFTYYFDDKGPTISIGKSLDSNKKLKLTFTVKDAVEGDGLSAGIDDKKVIEFIDPDEAQIPLTVNNNRYQCEISGLKDGNYKVKAYDALGNVSITNLTKKQIDSFFPELIITNANYDKGTIKDGIYSNSSLSYGINCSDTFLGSVSVSFDENDVNTLTYSIGDADSVQNLNLSIVACKNEAGKIKLSLQDSSKNELAFKELSDQNVFDFSNIKITVTDKAGNTITKYIGKEVLNGQTRLNVVNSLTDENKINAKLDIAAAVITANELKVKNADTAATTITDFTKDIYANDLISFGLSVSDDTLDEISIVVNDEEANKLVVNASEYIKANSSDSNNPFELSFEACNNNGKIDIKIVDKAGKEIVKKELADKSVLDLSKVAVTVSDKAGNNVTRYIGKAVSDDQTKLTVVDEHSDENKINAKLDIAPASVLPKNVIADDKEINEFSNDIYAIDSISLGVEVKDDALSSIVVKVKNGVEFTYPTENNTVNISIVAKKNVDTGGIDVYLANADDTSKALEVNGAKLLEHINAESLDLSNTNISVTDKAGNIVTKYIGMSNDELAAVDEKDSHVSAKLDVASSTVEVKDIYADETKIANFDDTIYAKSKISFGFAVRDDSLGTITVAVDKDTTLTYTPESNNVGFRLVAENYSNIETKTEGIKVSLVEDNEKFTTLTNNGKDVSVILNNQKYLDLSNVKVSVSDKAGNNDTVKYVGINGDKLVAVDETDSHVSAKLDAVSATVNVKDIYANGTEIKDFSKTIYANDNVLFGFEVKDDTLNTITVAVDQNKELTYTPESNNVQFKFKAEKYKDSETNKDMIKISLVDYNNPTIVLKQGEYDLNCLDLSNVKVSVSDKAGNKDTVKYVGINDNKLAAVDETDSHVSAILDIASAKIVATGIAVDGNKNVEIGKTLYAKDTISYGINVEDDTLKTITVKVKEEASGKVIDRATFTYSAKNNSEGIRLIAKRDVNDKKGIVLSLAEDIAPNYTVLKENGKELKTTLDCVDLDLSNIEIEAEDNAGNTITKYIGKNANNELDVVDENGSRVNAKLDIESPSVILNFIHTIGTYAEAVINERLDIITDLTITDIEPNQDNKTIDNTNVKVVKKIIVTSTKQLDVTDQSKDKGLKFNVSTNDNVELDRAFIKVYDNDKLLDGIEYGINSKEDVELKLTYDQINGYSLQSNGKIIVKNIPVNDDQLTFHVNAMDKSGNYGTQMICRVFIDDKAPVIEAVYPITEIKSKDLDSLIEDSNEWFYKAFNDKEIAICVNVRDVQEDKLGKYPIADGKTNIESVQYALYEDKDVDSSGNIIKDLDWKYVNKSTVTSPDNNKTVGNYKFIIPNNGKDEFLKTRIAIRVTDIYGNVSDNTYTCGIIIQKAPDHTISDLPITKINLDKAKYTGNVGNRKNVNLYANDIKPVLEVTDKAGIGNFYWSLDNYKVENETIFDETKFDNKDKHLRLYAKKTITVKEGNDQNITFVVTDNTGNKTTIKKTVSVDKSAPKAIVSFKGDKTANNYYKQDRDAVITITDANIDQNILNSDCILKYTENGVAKTRRINNFAGSDKEYSATIRFSENADFKITGIYVKDYAGNVCEKVNDTEKFTVDKIKPTVSVSYSGNAVNGNYFAASRTATITVNEHNFDASKMNIAITSSDNGQPFSVSNALSWSNNGDTHVATYTFGQDGKYQFVFNGEDKAGNKLETYQSPEFYVDLSDPTVDINIPNNSAHADEIAPVITIKDTNLDTNASTYQITASGNKKFDLVPNITNSGTQKVITFANFPKKIEYDEIYQLSVNGVDKSGRRVNKVVNFSVNRFGSTYKIVTDISKPFNIATEVVIIETNVSPISDVVIRVNHDSLTTDLKAGKDYTITKLDGAWNSNRYEIKSNVFSKDGEYIITISSKDAVGHDNYSGQESKKTSVKVTVDTTEPIVKAIGVESNAVYNEPGKEIKFSIFDNVGVKDFEILVNGQKLNKDQYVYDEETGEVTLKLAESSSAQKVEVVVNDVAGNKSVVSVDNVLVTTNAFVRLYSNKPLFIGLIFLILAILFFIFFILLKKKKKNEEEVTA